MRVLSNPFAILFISFLLGLVMDSVLRRFKLYGWLSTRFLFASSRTYENLGVLRFRKFLLATPLRYFNTSISFTANPDLESLKKVREYIATAEVSHWVGFVAMLGVTFHAWWNHGPKLGMAFVILNIIGNFFPCLLQQYNKRRLLPLISLIERRKTLPS